MHTMPKNEGNIVWNLLLLLNYLIAKMCVHSAQRQTSSSKLWKDPKTT
jgi:hypothetical protein